MFGSPYGPSPTATMTAMTAATGVVGTYERDGVKYRIIVVDSWTGGNGMLPTQGPFVLNQLINVVNVEPKRPTAWELKREASIRGVVAWTAAYDGRELSRAQHRADVRAKPRLRWSTKRRSAKAVRNWRRP